MKPSDRLVEPRSKEDKVSQSGKDREIRRRSGSEARSGGPRTPPDDQPGSLFEEIKKHDCSSRSGSRAADGSFAAQIMRVKKGATSQQDSPLTPSKRGRPTDNGPSSSGPTGKSDTNPLPMPAVLSPYASLPLPSVSGQPGPVQLQDLIPRKPKLPVS
jgi:hypothetical protein